MTGSAPQHTGKAKYNQVNRKTEIRPWKKWFAWHPVKVHGQIVWLKTVQRRCIHVNVDMNDWIWYEYSDISSIAKE